MANRLIQVVVDQIFLGQHCLNVFFYEWVAVIDPTGAWLENANTQFVENVWSPIQQVQSDLCVTQTITWKDLTGGVDFFVDSEPKPGTGGTGSDSTVAPSYTSLGFLLRRSTLATRNGYKRFAGLLEANISGNEFTGYGTVVDEIKVALKYVITGLGAPVMEPVIAKRPLPEPGESYITSGIQSVEFRGLGTQNTRKPGRGI